MTREMLGPRASHEHFRLLAAASVDGRLDPDSAIELERHLATCDACRADLAAMVADHAWLAAPADPVLPDIRIRHAVLDAARSPRVPRIEPRRPWLALVAAGFTVVIGGAILLGTWFPPSGPAARPSDGVAPTATPAPSPTTLGTPTPTIAPTVRGLSSGPCVQPPAGMAAWWRGDDLADAVAGHDGRALGGVRFAPGVVGDGITFDGDTAYVQVPYSTELDLGLRDFTIMLWFRFSSLDGEQVFVESWRDKAGGADATVGWTLTKLETNEVHLVLADTGTFLSAGTAPLSVRLDEWHHLAARRQANVILLYLDGEIVGGNDRLPQAMDVGIDSPILLGRRSDDRGFLFDGQLDEVKIVPGNALFESDILAEYLAGTTGTCAA